MISFHDHSQSCGRKDFFSYKYIWRAEEMAQWVRNSAPKPDDLSPTPCAHTVEGLSRVVPDLHVCQITHRVINANQFTLQSLRETISK